MDDKYFIGKPCKHGHGSVRYKSNRACVICQRLANDEYNSTLSDEEFKRQRGYNILTNRAKIRKRKADQLQRVPGWADLQAIKDFYAKCPPGYVVDHEIPLRGKLVSGFHIASNFQYLTFSENARKHNSFDPLTFDPVNIQYPLFPNW